MKTILFSMLLIAPLFATAQAPFDKVGFLVNTGSGYELLMREPVIQARGATYIKVYDVYEIKMAYPGFQKGRLNTVIYDGSKIIGSLARVFENTEGVNFDDSVFTEVSRNGRIEHRHQVMIEDVQAQVLLPASEFDESEANHL